MSAGPMFTFHYVITKDGLFLEYGTLRAKTTEQARASLLALWGEDFNIFIGMEH